MSLTVWSLNGGNFVGRTPDEESPTLTWLKKLSTMGMDLPDVLCLQHFRASLLEHLMRVLPHFHFAPMSHHRIWGKPEPVGVVIASRFPITNISIHYTWGDGIVREVEGVSDNGVRTEPYDVADALVLQTENYVVLAATVKKPGDIRTCRIATHHGLWTRAGATTPEQLQSTESLCAFLAEEGKRHGGIVYVGDCNPDAAGEVARRYEESGAWDRTPAHIKTTLAPHHPAAHLNIRSDRIMDWPDCEGYFVYDIVDVSVDPSPGSDHQMLRFRVDRS